MAFASASSIGQPATDLPTQTLTLLGPSEREVVARVADIGEGRTVVFLHGLVGLNDHWEDVAQRARRRVRCVLLELPLLRLRGADCSIDGVVRMTTRFLEDRVGEPAVLAGNSFGGHVALRIALDTPELVAGLVLAGSAGLIEKTMVSEVQTRPSREWLTRRIGELFFDPATHMREADIERAHKELSDRGGARAMIKLSRSARKDHLGERLSEVQASTLLIWGKNDVVTPPEAAHGFLARLPDARIVWFDRCGHAPMIECPEQFAEALAGFADELDRRHGVGASER